MRTWTNPRTAPKAADTGIMVMMRLDDGTGLRMGYARPAPNPPGSWALCDSPDPAICYPWRVFKKAHHVVKWAYVEKFFDKDMRKQHELDAVKTADRKEET